MSKNMSPREANSIEYPAPYTQQINKIKIKKKSLSLNNKTLSFQQIISTKNFGKLQLMYEKKNKSVRL